MIEKMIVQGNLQDPTGCVLALPGRGIPGDLMEKFMFHTGLWKSLHVILEPKNLEWYPKPNGADDQREALDGLARAIDVIESYVKKIERAWGIPKDKVGIVGFSAGAVMGIQCLAYSDKPYAGILSLAGAILDPLGLPKARHNTPVLLQHNMDDDCFKWEERYLPMKEIMVKQKYNVSFHEAEEGGHTMTHSEVYLCRQFMAERFGYLKDFEEIYPKDDDDDDDDDVERDEQHDD